MKTQFYAYIHLVALKELKLFQVVLTKPLEYGNSRKRSFTKLLKYLILTQLKKLSLCFKEKLKTFLVDTLSIPINKLL